MIVQQPDEGDKAKDENEDTEDQDLTIYDFDDAEDPGTNETVVYLLVCIRYIAHENRI